MDKYSSGLVSESFWFLEVKKIIRLLNDDKDWQYINSLCTNENLLGLSKSYRIKRVFGYLKNRIITLDDEALALFDKSDLRTQKIINLIAIAKNNRLFFEFLNEVYKEKVILKSTQFSQSDINTFFRYKSNQDEQIAQWSDVTFKRLRSTYTNFLTDAGLLQRDSEAGIYIITPPILDTKLELYLIDKGERKIIEALTGWSK